VKKAEQSRITRENMADTLLGFLKTRSIDLIKISDITNACNVDRQTFYYHFSDIYGLFEFAVGLKLLPLLRESSENLPAEERIDRILVAIAENKQALKSILGSGGRAFLYDSLFEEVAATLSELLGPGLEAGGVNSEREKEVLFIGQSIIISLIQNWILDFFVCEIAELKVAVINLAEDYVYGVSYRPKSHHIIK
jgi:AcrR family transcriptional regulator